jgi:hypothetical protein
MVKLCIKSVIAIALRQLSQGSTKVRHLTPPQIAHTSTLKLVKITIGATWRDDICALP